VPASSSLLLRWLFDNCLVGRKCLVPKPLDVGAKSPETCRAQKF
jgi:hypothetical protein